MNEWFKIFMISHKQDEESDDDSLTESEFDEEDDVK